jgi:hypothetical protein
VLVAVTLAVTAEEGAVKRPPEVMEPPPETDQVTAVLKLPVPCTLALHCEVAPVATLEGEQVGATEEMVGDADWGGAELFWLPQAIRAERTRQVSKARVQAVFKGTSTAGSKTQEGAGSVASREGTKR